MTSLKKNFDNFLSSPSHEIKRQNKVLTLDKLLGKNNKLDGTSQHKQLIQQISMKNNALGKHAKSSSTLHNSNYLTYCQKYAQMLCQKYDTSPSLSSSSTLATKHFRQQQNNVYTHLTSIQQTINKHLLLGRRYFQNSQFQFDKEYQELSLRIKQLGNILQHKFKYFDQKDQEIQDQLAIIELFVKRINSNLTKQPVTLFTHFVNEIKSKTYIKNNHHHHEDRAKNHNLSSKNQTDFQSKNTVPFNHTALKSSHLLNQYDDKQTDQNNLLISFKANLQNSSSNAYETLKYSESDLNINLERNIKNDQKQIIKEEQDYELQYSPVQPYRMHKLQIQKKQNHHKDKIKERKDSDEIFLDKEDAFIKTTTDHVYARIRSGTISQRKSATKLLQSLTHSISDLSQSIQATHTSISEQNLLINEQWSSILSYMNKDIEDIQNLLILQKNENDLKDKKFLQNLEIIQNELIEQIFAEKECRKAQQNVLTKVLTNLVESLQESSF